MRRVSWATTAAAIAAGALGALGPLPGAAADPLPILQPACRDLLAVDLVHEHDDDTYPDEDIDQNGVRVAFTTAAPTCGGLTTYRVRAVTSTGQSIVRSLTGDAGAVGFRVDLGPVEGPVCIDVTAGTGLLGRTLLVTDRLPDAGYITVAPGTGEPPVGQACADVVDGGTFDDGATTGAAGFVPEGACPGLFVVSRFSYESSNLDTDVRRIHHYDAVPVPPGAIDVVVPNHTSTAPLVSWAGGTASRVVTGPGEAVYLLLDELPDGGGALPARLDNSCPEPGGCGGFRFK